MNNQLQNQSLPLPDWKTDWLYALIFRELDDWCKCFEPDEYYLIEERDTDDGSVCTGAIIRAWRRNLQGIEEITLQEHLNLTKRRGEIIRFGAEYLARFHIHADRQRVVYGWSTNYLVGGDGGRYRVVGSPEDATLEYEGGGWIS